MPSEQPLDDAELVRAYTWQNIIFSREAKREGIKVTDHEVREEINRILLQQGINNPTQEQYRIWLARTLQISPKDFEEGLREIMRIQKLIQKKISGFSLPANIQDASPGDKEAAIIAQRESFIAWTDEVNRRARISDYLALTLRNNVVEVTNEVKAVHPSSETQPDAEEIP